MPPIDPITKQPIIRPGQRKPYVKATRHQIEERIQAAALLLAAGLTKCQIHRAFRERFNVEWRQTDRYLARARASAHSPPSPALPGVQPAP